MPPFRVQTRIRYRWTVRKSMRRDGIDQRAASASTAGLKAEGVSEADRSLCHLPNDAAVGDERALAQADEQLVPGVILPAIATREREVFADVVVLRLECDLHD